MPLPRRLSLAVTLALCCTAAWAEPEIGCPLTPRNIERLKGIHAKSDPNAPVELRARSIRTDKDGNADLEGAVDFTREGERVHAEHLHYDKATSTVDAEGQVEYRNAAGDRFRTEQMHMQMDTRVGAIGQSRYNLRGGLARGDAAQIEFQGPGHTRLTDLRYTTCREGQDDWFLKIGRLDLDEIDEIGTARHMVVRFFGVPLFYFPYVNFPIADQRKSGFLFPRVGYSDDHGYELFAPYYFNLAPNYDATVAPRFLSLRGLELQTEFRYLARDGRGKLEFDVLPNDKVAGDDRAVGVFQHQHVFNRFWSGNVDLRGVSDKQYFTDFGDRLSITSQTYLPQTVDLTHRGPAWTFVARLLDHQTIDAAIAPSDQPYARLPQLLLVNTQPPLSNRLYPQLEAEWNRFEHDVLLTGERLNLNPGLSFPLRNNWGFLTPKLGARYIGYNLRREDDASPTLARGVFSLDSGLIFERDTTWGNNATIQTLEPRLFYLYIPPKNQDTLPNFDSGAADFNLASLFRENRFGGGDRIGDANQITAAITTRFLDLDEGIERLRLGIGRIFYFDERQVNLPPGADDSAASDIVAEATAWLIGNWHARETVQWSKRRDRIERSSTYLQYHPAFNKILNFGHVFVRDQISQYDVSAEWPIMGRWSARGRSVRSVRDDRNIETYVGVEYHACCWALRVFGARRWIEPKQKDSIMVELQLQGLSKFGSAPESPLKQGLFSFQDEPERNGLGNEAW